MAKKKKKLKWVDVPQKTDFQYMSDWLVSHMIVEAHIKTGKWPKRIALPENCVKEQPDGSGIIEFFVQ